MESISFQCSCFDSVRSKTPVTVTLESFMDAVRSTRWKAQTEMYRELKLAGREEEAGKLKAGMPAISYAGVFAGGHKAENLQFISKLVCIDVDKYPHDIHRLKTLFEELPEVAATFVSISGCGIKVFVYVNIRRVEDYPEAYRAVMYRIAAVIKFPADTQCTDVSRLCFGACDEQAYFNPSPTPFEVPDVQVVIGWFAEVFEVDNPFVSGTRHDAMLKLGREARKRDFPFEELLALCTKKFTCADFSETELTACLRDGYSYASTRSKNQKSNLDSLALISEEERFEEGEELRGKTPVFPPEIFSNLPRILQQGLSVSRGDRERDMLLAGMLSVLSGCLQNCRAKYARKTYSAHFYFFGVADAGAGKGVVDFAHLLAVPLHKYYMEKGKAEMEQYERLEVLWSNEVKTAMREKRVPDEAMKPSMPRIPYLLIPPNSSKIRYLIHLRDNGEMGGIINTGETDTLTYALGQDCGRYDDLLRNATHHEVVGASHKSNGAPIIIPKPRLAMCLTGTPGQLFRLIASTENGLYSRFLLLTHNNGVFWRSAAPVIGEPDYEKKFQELGREVLEMSLYLLASPTFVSFTPAQWDVHTKKIGRRLSEVALEQRSSIEAVVFRHGLLVMRIAMVLTALRKWEGKWHTPDLCCSDEDFDTAMRIVLAALEHSILLSTSLESHVEKARPLSSFYRVRELFEQLSSTFSFSDIKTAGMRFGYSESSIKRYLTKAVKMDLIVKEKHGVYRKTGQKREDEK